MKDSASGVPGGMFFFAAVTNDRRGFLPSPYGRGQKRRVGWFASSAQQPRGCSEDTAPGLAADGSQLPQEE
jgi:hypothetical protein